MQRKPFFFHTESLTQKNHLKQQRCQQSVPSGLFFFVTWLLLLFAVRSTDFLICYGDGYKRHDGAAPVSWGGGARASFLGADGPSRLSLSVPRGAGEPGGIQPVFPFASPLTRPPEDRKKSSAGKRFPRRSSRRRKWAQLDDSIMCVYKKKKKKERRDFFLASVVILLYLVFFSSIKSTGTIMF